MIVPKGGGGDRKPEVDEGFYRVALTGVSDIYDKLNTYVDPPVNQSAINLTFTVIEDEDGDETFKGKELARNKLTFTQSERGALYPYLCALTGHKVAADEDIDLDELLGTEIMVEVVHNSKTYDDGVATFANLEDPRRIRRRKPRAEIDDDGFPVGDDGKDPF